MLCSIYIKQYISYVFKFSLMKAGWAMIPCEQQMIAFKNNNVVNIYKIFKTFTAPVIFQSTA